MMTQRITGGLTLAFGLLSVAAGLAYARRIGAVSPDMAMRGNMAAIGLMVAFYGNDIPKVVKSNSVCVRAVQRFAGWAFVLSGLAYAGIWALVPLDWAADTAMAAVGSALAAVIGYALWMRSRVTRA